MIEVAFAILGVIIGFLLSEGATRIRQAEAERKLSRSVRKIISLEIDRNLRLFQDYWNDLLRIPVDNPESRNKTLALRFVDAIMPHWQREAYSSQLPHLADALQAHEIVAVLQFYERLNELVQIREDLFRSSRGMVKTYTGERETTVPDSIEFNRKAPTSWEKCEQISEDIQGKGNPLSSDIPGRSLS